MKKANKKLKNIDKYIDSDKDGLTDWEEKNIYKTDPNNSDTDGDGLNDCDEIKMGFNPLIKDYFIPNKCNGYRPKALRPKRLLFYGLSAIVTKIIVVAVFVSVPLTALLTPDLLYSESQKIIALTNDIRQDIGVRLLVQNTQLTDAAMYKVQDMLLNQYFAHTSTNGTRLTDWLKKVDYNYLYGGENLAIGFEDANSVVDAWIKSPTHYSNLIDSDFSEIGVGAMSGKFNGYDTVLIAQYFGSQKKPKPVPITQTPEIPVEENLESDSSGQEAIPEIIEVQTPETTEPELIREDIKPMPPIQENVEEVIPEVEDASEISSTQEQNVLAEKQEIVVDEQKTNIIIQETPVEKEKVVQATVYLSDNINNANVTFQDKKIELTQNPENISEWSGSTIIEDEEQKILVPGILEATDNNGNIFISDVKLENITPQKTSLGDQYLFAKQFRNDDLNTIFTFSSIYYKIILALTLLLLLINIFVKIKIQKFDVILSSTLLIILMGFLIII